MISPIQRIGVIGVGVIGASWTALFLARGLSVSATDVALGAEAALRKYVDDAWPALSALGQTAPDPQARLSFSADLDEAMRGVDFVQENGPERMPFKQKLYHHLDELLPSEVIIASSSSGLTMSEIQRVCEKHPERCVIGHPFNPPHLIPLVELVAGVETAVDTVESAARFYDSLGKRTIRLNKEVPGHVANRLQAALFREVVYLIDQGVVSVADADAALSWGPGLRWGAMGAVELSHLAGGSGGIEHFFDQFTGPMSAWWQVLGAPELTQEVQGKIIDGLHAEIEGRSFQDLAEERDRVLIELLRARGGPGPKIAI